MRKKKTACGGSLTEPEDPSFLPVPEVLSSAAKGARRKMPEVDADCFAAAVRDVRPLTKRGRDIPLECRPGFSPLPRQRSFQELFEETPEFSLHFSREYFEGHVTGLDLPTLRKLRGGAYRPEAHLDLHGFSTCRAFHALLDFIRRSWFNGLRTVLLIPGRGRNSPNGVAVLRDRVQIWLTREPLKRVVLAFCTAGAVDGGPGGLYVLLRKYKKRGRILWDRIPADEDL
jgi:DNA-nicking Smr family endonuclease